MGQTPREALAESLRPLTSRFGWLLVTGEAPLNAINKITVVLHQKRIEPLPAAPMGAHIVSIIAQVISPIIDRVKAEDQLDDAVNEFIHALDDAGHIWSSAEKVAADPTHLAYDVTIDVVSHKE